MVVKVGSRVVGSEEYFSKISAQLAEQLALREVILVSSGAVLLGRSKLGLTEKPQTIPLKQAAAAAGQSLLMRRYEDAFEQYGRYVAQVLLSHDDLADRTRFLNARRAMQQLIAHKILPIINENDTVATQELRFGDNDHLSALVVGLCEADLLIILSDIDALYEQDPRQNPAAKPLHLVENAERLTADVGGASESGTGGMITKVRAAAAAARVGVPTVLASGLHPNVLGEIFGGHELGTLFLPSQSTLSARKHWIAYALRPKGSLQVDAGARMALVEKKKSLLPSGIIAVQGEFAMGDSVRLLGPDGEEFARGLAGYDSDEILKIKGKNTSEIQEILGYRSLDEVVHRDDLVVLTVSDHSA